jgi:hypothetical protein
MTDPRNVAHDKRVQQEKKHKHQEISPGAEHSAQPGKKPHMAPKTEPVEGESQTDGADSPDTPDPQSH